MDDTWLGSMVDGCSQLGSEPVNSQLPEERVKSRHFTLGLSIKLVLERKPRPILFPQVTFRYLRLEMIYVFFCPLELYVR